MYVYDKRSADGDRKYWRCEKKHDGCKVEMGTGRSAGRPGSWRTAGRPVSGMAAGLAG